MLFVNVIQTLLFFTLSAPLHPTEEKFPLIDFLNLVNLTLRAEIRGRLLMTCISLVAY